MKSITTWAWMAKISYNLVTVFQNWQLLAIMMILLMIIAYWTKKKATNENITKTDVTILHAPLSGFDFCRNFTSEEYFMVKLCHICDKANVPHHVIDDIVCLLQECKINNIQLQPEKLLKRNNFLKHLENVFTVQFLNQLLLIWKVSQAMIFIT